MLRNYQQRAIDQLYDWFSAGNEGNPCLVLPTGAGKSHIIAAMIKNMLSEWPETRVLMLTHQKELISQNAEKMRQHWPGAPLGIYSAALRRRQLDEPITFAGIQSVARRGAELGHTDIIIIDEAHSINHAEAGSYRKLIGELSEINPALRCIGLTATPYRLGHGMINEGDDVLFSALIEPVTIKELIELGHLSPLRSKHTSYQLDATGVKKSGGEYVASALEQAMDTVANNANAIDETILRAADRKSWLFFCAGVDHAQHVCDMLNERGIPSACVTGATPSGERDAILRDFKAGRIRAVTNVNVLTTGFDHPGIDCLVMLRPTLSPGLYVQMAGRGMRVSPEKSDCLVLDFAGNVARHGPITAVIPPRKAGKSDGVAPTKTCPSCEETLSANARRCECCGYEFPPPEKQESPPALANDDIMGIVPSEMLVTSWSWRRHVSRASGKEMLKVSYYGGLSDPRVDEYLTICHDGYAGQKAMRTLAEMKTKSAAPDNDSGGLDGICAAMNAGQPPTVIGYHREGKFFRVAERVWR